MTNSRPPNVPPSIAPPRADTIASRRVRDPYADLLRDTRGLRRDQAAAREAWYAGLAVEKKEEALFELEMLLKGVVAWSNPRNHPGGRARAMLHERDFRLHLGVARAAVARASALCALLLGPQRKTSALGRNLPVGFGDEPRGERVDPPETPEGSLQALRQALAMTHEVMTGLLTAERVSFRVFYASITLVQREVARNAFFNPLVALEFRPEFDRLRVPDVLDAILSVDGEVAHRLVALAYLGSFRLLRMGALLQVTAADPEGARRAYALLAAMRAESRALQHVLRGRSPAMLADAYERDLVRVPAVEMRARYDAVTRDGERLLRLRAVLLAVGAALRAETRRTMELRVPACDAQASPLEVAAAITGACAKLRDALQGSVQVITWALRGAADPERLTGERHARRAASERTRHAAWMFTVVTRAFVTKARAADTDDLWTTATGLEFVHEYLGYFRAIGHALALETAYPQIDRFALTLQALRDTDWIDASRLQAAVEACQHYIAHLLEVIESAGRREELRAVPFDKQVAAETLRMHLGA